MRQSGRTRERVSYTALYSTLAILRLRLLFCVTASKRERLVNNLQNLSVSDRVRMLREMPLSVAEKSNLR